MSTLADLHMFEKNALVEDVLSAYLNVTPDRICHALTEDEIDLTKYWADNCGMSVADLIDWIDASLRYPAKFTVIKEHGSGGGWPECQLDLDAGAVLFMDWVTDNEHCADVLECD